ncbi:hypothetical protein MAR_024229 [Mya arenaria]|uniref:BTB domain-containing protein n=1 Tax=Mya arenaria TaxID=6604 RepID=A0ABY7DQ65_MYAAR|nr:uncharacterized protein LOC128228649 isoform X1 [Mya arenaria]WAQ99856.1 hypothetical protein MAR_024229 [Mya arenaria]
MEYQQYYENRFTNSELTAMLRQVNEQDEHSCDVSVKVGTWVRRFHTSILKESGFFNTLFGNGKFRENTFGIIEFCERRSTIVEGAILFLYNEEPVIDTRCIQEFFDIAEFLMIPRLKIFCVKWFEQTQKTNALIDKYLPVSILYDVDIASAIDYIRTNLRELMDGSSLLNIDTNSLQSLLSDKYLSYVSMEIKFNFLVRWLKIDFLKRSETFQQMCAWIDFRKLSEAIIMAAKQDPIIGSLEVVSNYEYEKRYDESQTFVGMIVKHEDSRQGKETVIIYDEIKDDWYRLNISLTYIGRKKYFTNTNNKSTFFRVRETPTKDTVIELLSVDGRTFYRSKVTVQTYDTRASSCNDKVFDSICINDQTCVATRMTMVDIIDASLEKRKKEVIQLLVGNIEANSDTTVLYPMFSMELDDGDGYHYISNICLNADNNVALIIPTFNHYSISVYIYEIKSCSLSKIENSEISPNSKVYGCRNGFAFSDEEDPYVTLIEVPEDTDSAHDIVTVFVTDHLFERMIFASDDKLYHFLYYPWRENYILEMAAIDEIERMSIYSHVKWERVTSLELKVELIQSVIQLQLPTNVDRCHLLCPHCESLPRGQKRGYFETCNVSEMSNEQSERDDITEILIIDLSDDEESDSS